MRITVVSFQRSRNPPLEEAERKYILRLARHAQVELVKLRSARQGGLPERLLRSTYRIGLFVEGRTYSSEQLARHLQDLVREGHSHLVLVLGGPEGMPAEAAAQVHERWSLSPLTFSHQLARLVLLEALYRSWDILAGGAYHK
ncbi:MAG: 23S rRNA (pseudouridine(1915)-N(3))-methyltransferase RlmH [Candidatus Latescibacterota bacterium]